ncbi:MAG TPA: DNA gyrase subunit A [Thermosulfidibacter takaii]|uniref:DNA gyrase subunit A n=1 Tax=Thermosulfidibacter takaii TaxID=412593 RepID=A0A7C0U5T1_9BACT|nr:DNA gyrase subunit A [Thermosulfidibacter takaii]
MSFMAQVIPISIEEEMKSAYIDYAMSVIVGRALPDIRDGLKPVHRRILYAMQELGLWHNRPFKKSARVVGEVLGKFHPHGDAAVYDALVRMAQEFTMRYPLVDGQGNFGSLDGDPPAAMRYTEVRITALAEEFLRDIEKDTVDFVPNFDGSFQEPTVLPARVPNLLVNGTSGIAVGMATNIPPHNLSEVVDALVYMIDHPEATVEELMNFIQGPDFPTGAFICGRDEIIRAYKTGRGSLRLRAKVEVEQLRGKRQALVVKEIPYQLNKASLVERISQLALEGKLEEVQAVRDESDRHGVRIVMELKRDEDPDFVLKKLYRYTPLETGFGIILIALVDGAPRLLSLPEMLKAFLDFRREVVTRRTLFDLERARDRAHILEGLKIALDHLDEIIALIRASDTPQEARQGLMGKFALSEKQAQAILDMRLQRLTALERDKIEKEYQEVLALIKELETILGEEAVLWKVIKDELLQIRERYGDERRTGILQEVEVFDPEEFIKEEDMVVTLTHRGLVKRTLLAQYRSQRKGGRGKKALEVKDEDFVEHLYVASTLDYLLFFTNRGKVHLLKVYEIPEGSRQAKGKPINQLLRLDEGEKVTAFAHLMEKDQNGHLMMATRLGVVKKVSLDQFRHVRRGGIIAIHLDEGDELISVKPVDQETPVIIGTRRGRAIVFSSSQVRAMGRAARGVRGIRLASGDVVVGMEVLEGEHILTVTEKGYGKRTPKGAYRVQARGGQGVTTHRLTDRTGRMVAILAVNSQDELFIATHEGMAIRLKAQEVSVMGRSTQGVKLMDLPAQDVVVGVSLVREREDEE